MHIILQKLLITVVLLNCLELHDIKIVRKALFLFLAPLFNKSFNNKL
jgi:hypothetical protein